MQGQLLKIFIPLPFPSVAGCVLWEADPEVDVVLKRLLGSAPGIHTCGWEGAEIGLGRGEFRHDAVSVKSS